MWIVIGGGLAASLGLVRTFGSVPFMAGTPPPESGHAGTPEPAPTTAEPTARPYVLDVVTEPAGARVSADGQSVISPGQLRFDRFQPPLQVTAQLAGYPNATASVWPSHFTQKDDRYAGRLEPRFEGPAKPATTTTSGTAPAALRGSASTSPPKPAATPSPEPAQHAAASSSTAPAPHGGAPIASKSDKSDSTHSHESHESSHSAQTAPRKPTSAPAAPAEPPPPVVSVTPVAAEPADSAHGTQSPMEQALDCLGRGDNRCVIRALEDKASSAREMELLIETYRAVGSTPRAEREMERYLKRYPAGQRAEEYKQVLENRAAATPAPEK
jgi:hypothetical protein